MTDDNKPVEMLGGPLDGAVFHMPQRIMRYIHPMRVGKTPVETKNEVVIYDVMASFLYVRRDDSASVMHFDKRLTDAERDAMLDEALNPPRYRDAIS